MNWRQKIKNLIPISEHITITEKDDFIRIDDKNESNSYLTCSFTEDGSTLKRAYYSRLIKLPTGGVFCGHVEAVFDPNVEDCVRFIQNESEYKEIDLLYGTESEKLFERFVSIPLFNGWREIEYSLGETIMEIEVQYLDDINNLKAKRIFLRPEESLAIPLASDLITIPLMKLIYKLKSNKKKR